MNILLIFLINIFHALSDGFFQRTSLSIGIKNKYWSGIFMLFMLTAICLSILFVRVGWWIFPGFMFVRIAVFAPIRNLLAEDDWYYIGTTKPLDRLVRRFFKQPHAGWMLLWKIVCAIMAGVCLI